MDMTKDTDSIGIPQQERASTGVAGLDDILGGGLAHGTSTSFSGPSGVGKTTTALACVRTALQRGERAAYYLFDEGLDTLLARSRALGLNVDEYRQNAQLQIFTLDPAEVSPGQYAQMVRSAVEERGVQIVVIDRLNAYMQAMTGDKHLLLQMHEQTIREFRLGSQGVEVGEALTDFEGVLRGMTTYRRSVPLLGETRDAAGS